MAIVCVNIFLAIKYVRVCLCFLAYKPILGHQNNISHIEWMLISLVAGHKAAFTYITYKQGHAHIYYILYTFVLLINIYIYIYIFMRMCVLYIYILFVASLVVSEHAILLFSFMSIWVRVCECDFNKICT